MNKLERWRQQTLWMSCGRSLKFGCVLPIRSKCEPEEKRREERKEETPNSHEKKRKWEWEGVGKRTKEMRTPFQNFKFDEGNKLLKSLTKHTNHEEITSWTCFFYFLHPIGKQKDPNEQKCPHPRQAHHASPKHPMFFLFFHVPLCHSTMLFYWCLCAPKYLCLSSTRGIS